MKQVDVTRRRRSGEDPITRWHMTTAMVGIKEANDRGLEDERPARREPVGIE